jgi:hypothetical protein
MSQKRKRGEDDDEEGGGGGRDMNGRLVVSRE